MRDRLPFSVVLDFIVDVICDLCAAVKYELRFGLIATYCVDDALARYYGGRQLVGAYCYYVLRIESIRPPFELVKKRRTSTFRFVVECRSRGI